MISDCHADISSLYGFQGDTHLYSTWCFHSAMEVHHIASNALEGCTKNTSQN